MTFTPLCHCCFPPQKVSKLQNLGSCCCWFFLIWVISRPPGSKWRSNYLKKMLLDMHEKPGVVMLNFLSSPSSDTSYRIFFLPFFLLLLIKYCRADCLRNNDIYKRKTKIYKTNVDILSWLKSPSRSLVSLKPGPHMGPEWSELPVVRGAADSAAQFVLICPLGEPSGEISWILLQMFHCVCMLGIGVGPFDLNENAPQRFCSAGERQLCSQSRPAALTTSGFSQVSPRRVDLLWSETWEYHGPSPWSVPLPAQPATIWQTPVETLRVAASIANTCIPFIWHSTAFSFLITALLSSISPARDAEFRCTEKCFLY